MLYSPNTHKLDLHTATKRLLEPRRKLHARRVRLLEHLIR